MTIELGFGLDHLVDAFEKFELAEDKQYQALKNLTDAKKKKDEQDFVDSCSCDQVSQARYLEATKSFGKPQFKADQTMTFDYFMRTKLHSLEESYKLLHAKFDQMKETRRALFKEVKGKGDQMEKYYLLLIKKVAMASLSERIFDSLIY